MIVAVLRRVGAVVLTLVASSFVIFGALYAAPGDPVTFLIGNPENVTPERIAAVRAEYHLDEPFVTQFWIWAKGLLHGDLGSSFVYQQPVSALLGSRLPVTLTLVAFAAILFIVIGVSLGAVSALRRGSKTDSAIIEVSGSGSGFGDRLYHLTLPAVALALGGLATMSRVTRQTMVEQQSLDHVEAARSYGMVPRKIVTRHVLRNSLGPVVTMSGLHLAGMLAGTVVIEGVFGLNGIGSLLVDAINSHDFPVVQAILLYMVVAYMLVTIALDLAYPLIDPRTAVRREN